jgi:hypothetical protein
LIGRKFCFYLKNDRSSKLFLVRKWADVKQRWAQLAPGWESALKH